MANEKHVLVLKIGGNQVEDDSFLAGFVAAVKDLLGAVRCHPGPRRRQGNR